jgi:putative oligomerization/nucleic acid binding protein
MLDLQGSGGRERIVDALRSHGIDPERPGRIDITQIGGLQEALMSALEQSGMATPEGGRLGGGVSLPPQDTISQLEELARQRDAGAITEAEFQEQKRKLLG